MYANVEAATSFSNAPTPAMAPTSLLLWLPLALLLSVAAAAAGTNVIDACWRSDPNWASNRQGLADCVVGFGKAATGGKHGDVYVVIDPSDDPVDPQPGTLRYGAIQGAPLWIVFKKDMMIRLKNELILGSYKTIDGRGANVEIADGPCITIDGASHVIIHGLTIHDCSPGERGEVRDSPTHVGRREGSDGDGIAIFASSNVWVDHCTLYRSADGLIDVLQASTLVTISNCYFSNHDKVMKLGHSDGYSADKAMKVTLAFNRFAATCVRRMPRVRFGFAHVANNKYDGWKMYAVGGNANPTIFSEGNYYVAPKNAAFKEVTKREEVSGTKWMSWKWKSAGDVFMNGAYFVQSGFGTCLPEYSQQQSFRVADGSAVPSLTADAGVLNCVVGKAC